MIKITFKENGNPMFWKQKTMIGDNVVSPLYENLLSYNPHAVKSEWGYLLHDKENSIVSKIEKETDKAVAVRVGVCGGRDFDEAKANLLLWIPKSKIEKIEEYSHEQVIEDMNARRCVTDYK